jgi:hypothetical protein
MPDDDPKNGPDDQRPLGDIERMSLASLKRELAAQQAATTEARLSARERIVVGVKPSVPWRAIVAVSLVTLALLAGFIYYARQSLVVAEWGLPEFIVPRIDAGPPVVAAPVVVAAPAPPVGAKADRPRIARRRVDGGPGAAAHGSPRDPLAGEDDDPIGGLVE